MLKEYVPDSALRYVRNDNYWQKDKGLPYLDSYNILLISDPTTTESAFMNGESSYVETNDANLIKFLDSRGYKNKAILSAGMWSYFVAYPTSSIPSDPFNNANVRKAVLLYGIDWNAIANACTGGYGTAHLQEVSQGCYG